MLKIPSLRAWFAKSSVQATAASDPLARIVQPQARDKWLTARLKSYTPDRIEGVLTSAMSGNLVAVWELFDLMEATWPRLMKNLNEFKRAVLALDWNVQPWSRKGEQPTPEAQRRAGFVEDVLWQMMPTPAADENHFESTLYDLLDAWGKGISAVEIDWELRRSAYWSPPVGIAPRATRWIHPRYYGYPMSGTMLMLNQRELGAGSLAGGSMDGYVPFPENKFLLAVAKHKTGHPVGAALLRPLAFWWCASNFSAEWLLNFAQIFGLPIRWATYDKNQPGLLDLVSAMLENMGSAGWAAFPAGTQLELKEATKSGADNPQAYLLNLADKVCDILILGQTLTTDVGDSGSRALGDVHQSVRADVIQAAADWVATVLNQQFIPAICRLNFGDAVECPWLMPARDEVKDAKGMAERDQILLNCGVALPKGWFYDRHDVPVPAADEEVIRGGSPAATGQVVPGSGFGVPPSGGRGENAASAKCMQRHVAAKAAEEVIPTLVAQAVADAAGARVRWLAPVQEELDRLIALAKDEKLSDAELARFIDQAARSLPDLFAKMDVNALADSLEAALGAGAVAGLANSLKK